MDKFIGKWKLTKNDKFDEFLEFLGFSWLKRKAAVLANIYASFLKTDKTDVYVRIIDSTFLKEEEEYIFDNLCHDTPHRLTKKHYLEGEKVISLNSKTSNKAINWREEAIIINDQLIISRFWLDKNNKLIIGKQYFSKY